MKNGCTDILFKVCLLNPGFKVGDLLYCHNRGETTCCIHNHTCSDWHKINGDMSEIVLSYMTDKVQTLKL